jgi:predicted transcriptional regulator
MKTPAQRLREFLDDDEHPERSRTWLGKILGISQAAVSQWIVEEPTARPSEKHRVAIERIAGIPAEAWDTPAERTERRKREAAISAAVKSTGTE